MVNPPSQQPVTGDDLRLARTSAGLDLKDIGGFSVSHYSRIERGLATINRDVVLFYSKATGDDRLLGRWEQSTRHPSKADGPLDYDLDFVVEEVRGDVRVQEGLVRISEQRLIRPLREMSGLNFRRHLAPVDGRIPRLLRVEGTRAHVDSVDWITETYLGVKVSFPQPLAPHQPHQVNFEWELDRMFPSYTMTALVRAAKFGVTLQLAAGSKRRRVLAFDGLPSSVARDMRDAALNGRANVLRDVEVDRFGTYEVVFRNLSPGLTYGIMWLT